MSRCPRIFPINFKLEWSLLLVVQSLSHVQLFATPRTAAFQALLSFTISRSLLKLMSIVLVMVSNHLILYHPTSPFAFSLSQNQSFPMNWLFTSIDQSVGALASVLLKNIQGLISFRIDWFNLPSNSHESSPAPQFESIYSLALSLLYGPTLTSVHDYWKNHSFDYIELCQQRDVSAF